MWQQQISTNDKTFYLHKIIFTFYINFYMKIFMLRKKLESESRIRNPNLALKLRISDSGFLIIYENPADPGFGLPSLIFMFLFSKAIMRNIFFRDFVVHTHTHTSSYSRIKNKEWAFILLHKTRRNSKLCLHLSIFVVISR